MDIIRQKWDTILETVRNEHELTDISFKTWLEPLTVYDVEERCRGRRRCCFRAGRQRDSIVKAEEKNIVSAGRTVTAIIDRPGMPPADLRLILLLPPLVGLYQERIIADIQLRKAVGKSLQIIQISIVSQIQAPDPVHCAIQNSELGIVGQIQLFDLSVITADKLLKLRIMAYIHFDRIIMSTVIIL